MSATMSAPVDDDDHDDNWAAAEDAGLRYVCDAESGIRRIRCGRGFRYVDADGAPVTGPRIRQRIDDLVIPPAWTDVWICEHPRGHLQATGRDARGRKQYRYHDRWRTVRDEKKFDRLPHFGEVIGPLRESIDSELRRRGELDRDKVLALVVRLLDETLIRVGSAEYARDNESYGLTTIGPEHVDVQRAHVQFHFTGKGGVDHEVAVDDRRLARLVKQCHELGGQELFAWVGPGGELVDVGSSDVNDWLRERTGQSISAKDFRTWGGTVVAAEVLAAFGPPDDDAEADAQIIEAVDAAAAQLGNTRAVCRASYVHPHVLEAHRDGELHDSWAHSRRTAQLSRAERTVLHLLDR